MVQVGSLIATMAGIGHADFAIGRYAFSQAGQAGAPLTNQGSITAAQGGLAAFVAPGVANAGVINARPGKVALAAGNSFFLDLYGDHLVNLVVGSAAPQVTNSGMIIADGRTVQLTAQAAKGVVDGAINMSGVIQARAVASQGGTIVLEGAGAGQTGGTVKVLGEPGGADGRGAGGCLRRLGRWHGADRW